MASNLKRPQEESTDSSKSKPKACFQCKRDHKKCGCERPCARCVALGIHDCHDIPNKKLGRPKKRRLGEECEQPQFAKYETTASPFGFNQQSYFTSFTTPVSTPMIQPTPVPAPEPEPAVSASTALLASILKEIKSLSAVTTRLQEEQVILRESIAAINVNNPSVSLPRPAVQEDVSPPHFEASIHESNIPASPSTINTIVNSLTMATPPASPISSFLGQLEQHTQHEQQEHHHFYQPRPFTTAHADARKHALTTSSCPSAKHRKCPSYRSTYPTGPSFFNDSFSPDLPPYVAPFESYNYTSRISPMSARLAAQSGDPIYELYEKCMDLPFVLDDFSKPFFVMQLLAASPETKEALQPGCPFGNIIFSRVSVSRALCDLLGYEREEELLGHDANVNMLYWDDENAECVFDSAYPYLFNKSSQPASPVLWFEPKFITKDGRVVPALTKAQIFYGPMGDAGYIVMCLEEVYLHKVTKVPSTPLPLPSPSAPSPALPANVAFFQHQQQQEIPSASASSWEQALEFEAALELLGAEGLSVLN